MKLFISDFHLGSPLFDKMEKVLELFNSPDIDEIYLLGDIFDDWEMDPLESFYQYESFFTFLNFTDKRVVVLQGNHDPSLEFMKEVFFNVPVLVRMDLNFAGRRVTLTHGHEVDETTWIGRKIFFLHYWAQRWLKVDLKDGIRDMWHDFLMKVHGYKNAHLVLGMEKKLYERYKNDCEILICGHTHELKVVALEGLMYVNTGNVIKNGEYMLAYNTIIKSGRL